MLPTFELFGKTISVYAVFATVGILTAGTFVCRRAKKAGLDTNDMLVLMLFAGAGVFLGGHLLYAITQTPLILRFFTHFRNLQSFSQYLEVAYHIFGGSVFYGGLIGGIAAAAVYITRKRLPWPVCADILAPAIPLFHAFGRVGCFFGGCCYGVECQIGFTYSHALLPEANGVNRFPIQLMEACFNLTLFLLLWTFLKRGLFHGKLLYLYLCSYSIGRFFLEFGRGDTLRGFFLCFSTSQWISMLLFFLSAGILVYQAAGKRRSMNLL